MSKILINFLSHYFLLASIIILGIIKRMQGIINGTFGFTHDQGRDVLAAYNVSHGDFTLIGPTSGLAGLFHGPLWYYILAFFSFLGGGNAKVILGGVVFLFLAFEIVLFLVIKKYYGLFAASILFIVISLSPLYSSLNGQLWSPSLVLLSSMLMAIAVIEIIHGKRWYVLLGLALGANIQFEAAGGTFLLLSTILTLYVINPLKTKSRDYLLLFVSIFVTLIPQIIFELRYGFLMTRHALGYLGQSKSDFIAEHGIKTVEYKTGLLIENFSKTFFDNIDLSLLLFAILFIFLAKLFLKRKHFESTSKVVILYSISTIFFFWTIINFYFDVVWNHFIDGLTIFFLLIIVMFIYNLNKYYKSFSYLLASLLIFMMLIPITRGINPNIKIVGDVSYYKNQLEIIDDIYRDADGADFNVVVYEPTTFSYQYDYLFMWYGSKKYGMPPVSNETQVRYAYYLIEPDNIAGRREKWIKERDGEGVILWEKKYWDSNFTVQKRVRENIK